MPIARKRLGVGRPSDWKSPTKMMRLPACWQSEIIEYARRLDSSGSVLDQAIDAVLLELKPADRRYAKALFVKLKRKLGV